MKFIKENLLSIISLLISIVSATIFLFTPVLTNSTTESNVSIIGYDAVGIYGAVIIYVLVLIIGLYPMAMKLRLRYTISTVCYLALMFMDIFNLTTLCEMADMMPQRVYMLSGITISAGLLLFCGIMNMVTYFLKNNTMPDIVLKN